MYTSQALINLSYLVAGVLFILSLRGLSSQETARRGNLYGIVGMLIAIGATLASNPDLVIEGARPGKFHALVFLAIAVGAAIGAIMA